MFCDFQFVRKMFGNKIEQNDINGALVGKREATRIAATIWDCPGHA